MMQSTEKPTTSRSVSRKPGQAPEVKQSVSKVVEQPKIPRGSAKERRFTEIINKIKDDVSSSVVCVIHIMLVFGL